MVKYKVDTRWDYLSIFHQCDPQKCLAAFHPAFLQNQFHLSCHVICHTVLLPIEMSAGHTSRNVEIIHETCLPYRGYFVSINAKVSIIGE